MKTRIWIAILVVLVMLMSYACAAASAQAEPPSPPQATGITLNAPSQPRFTPQDSPPVPAQSSPPIIRYKPGSGKISPVFTGAGPAEPVSPAFSGSKQPMKWNEGNVQRYPHVYVIFWGKDWNTETEAKEAKEAILNFYRWLPGSGYGGILTQMFDRNGPITTETALSASYTDEESAHPVEITREKIMNEVQQSITNRGWGTPTYEDQFVVYTPTKSTYSFNIECGMHQWSGEPRFFVWADSPWQTGCLEGLNNAHAEQVTAAHEWAEAATDPIPVEGFYGWSNTSGEIADRCQGEQEHIEAAPGIFVAKIFDNSLNAATNSEVYCNHNNPTPYRYTVASEEPSVTLQHATLHGQIEDADYYAAYRWKVEHNNLVEYFPSSGFTPITEQFGDVDVGREISVKGQTAYHTTLESKSLLTHGEFSENEYVTSSGEKTFTTPDWRPTVTTEAGTSIGSTTATLNGAVNPNGLETKYYFEYGHTTVYGSKTAEVGVGAGTTSVKVNKELTGLEFGSTYHYRLVASNSENEGVTSKGADQSFTLGWRLQSNAPPSGASSDELSGVSCVPATNCMGAGNYVNSSGVEVPLAEQWNGSSWQVLAAKAPSTATQSSFQGVSCPSASSCTAVGFFFTTTPGRTYSFAEHWNGSEWETPTVFEPEKGGVKLSRDLLFKVSCGSASACMAVGYEEIGDSFVERWDGTTWHAEFPKDPERKEGEPTKERTTPESVSCASATDCEIVGIHEGYSKSIGYEEGYGMHWNGTTWSSQLITVKSQDNSWLNGVSCSSTTACTAVGSSANGHTSESLHKPLAERWNGTTWTEQESLVIEGSPETYFESVACPSASSCLAVGSYTGNNPVAMRWNGSSWELHKMVKPSGLSSLYVAGVSCSSVTSCMAVGNWTNSSNYHGSLSESYQKVLPATVTTKAATGATESEATLKGTVNPNGSEAKYWFEYGTTTGYGTKTTETSAGSGSSPVEESKAISGLEAGVKYHFRIVASNSESTAYGKDEVVETEAGTKGALASMKVTDPFNETNSAISNFGTNWSALGWAGGATPKGLDRTTGWGPSDAYSTVNGAYYQPTVTDVGSGIADQATLATNPGGTSRYFSLWLDMGTPGSTKAGYELRFTDTASNTYTVTLSKWVSGSQTVLATKEGYSFVNGNSFALADQGGTVTAWTNTGSGFSKLLTSSDSAFAGGNAGVEGSGNITRLTNFKVGALLKGVSNTDAALKALPVNDAFSTNESPLSESGTWAALQWDNGTSSHNTGQDTTVGWGPYDAFSTINGAYWTKASFADTGAGDATAIVLGTSPGIESRYFSVWLNSPTPASAHSGYELRFTYTGTNIYEVALLKWSAGTKTTLATKTGYSFAAGNKFALVDKAGTVSAWTNTGTEYTQLLSASDSSFTSGYTGVEASGNNTRLKEFRSGPMAPF